MAIKCCMCSWPVSCCFRGGHGWPKYGVEGRNRHVWVGSRRHPCRHYPALKKSLLRVKLRVYCCITYLASVSFFLQTANGLGSSPRFHISEFPTREKIRTKTGVSVHSSLSILPLSPLQAWYWHITACLWGAIMLQIISYMNTMTADNLSTRAQWHGDLSCKSRDKRFLQSGRVYKISYSGVVVKECEWLIAILQLVKLCDLRS